MPSGSDGVRWTHLTQFFFFPCRYDVFVVESDNGFEWYLVFDLCKGGTLYNYLQKKSAKPKEISKEPEEKPEEEDFLGLGGLVAEIAGEEEKESDIEEGEFYGLDEEDAKNVMTQVMSCVNYLHKNRLVHAGKYKSFCQIFFDTSRCQKVPSCAVSCTCHDLIERS